MSRTYGTVRQYPPGQNVDLRRDPSAGFPLQHEKVSRRAHAELVWTDGRGWSLCDVSGRQAVFVDGAPAPYLELWRPTLVRLGDGTSGEDLEIRPEIRPEPAPGPATAQAVRQPFDRAVDRAVDPAPAVSDRPPVAMFDAPLEGVTMAVQPTVAAAPGVALPAWRLAVTVDDATTTFAHEPVGQVLAVGRDPGCHIRVRHPAVSRHHADVISVAEGWRYIDRSTGGTWRDGDRMSAVSVDRAVALRLGDALTGPELHLDVSVPAEVQRRRRRRSQLRRSSMVAVPLVVAAVVAIVLALTIGRSSTPATTPTSGITQQTLLAVERATVKLDIVGSDGQVAGWGSGSIVDPHGLILTNSHVADPNAFGITTQYGAPLGDANPAYLIVDLRGAGPDGTVHARYRARKVIADGYLDLALVQIYADAKGHPVNPATLHLPTLPVGNSNTLQVGDNVTVVGFPGVSQSRSATVTKGDASAFVTDDRLHSDRAWIETSARIAHGNSGGAAVNDQGQLVGVPTRIAPEHEGDVGWWFRPVNWAKPLLARVASHRTAGYVTPYVKPAVGATLQPLGWNSSERQACSGGARAVGATAATGTSESYLAVEVAGLAKGLPFNAQINGPAGYQKVVTGSSSGTTQSCFTVPVVFGNGDGHYTVLLSVDPPGNATRVADITVGG